MRKVSADTRRLYSAIVTAVLAALPMTCGAADKTIKIGVDLPLSGGDAANGIPTRNGIVLAVERANAKGVPGGFTFVVDDRDDAVQGAHDPSAGAANTRAFVSDPSVLAMIGPFNSNVAKAEIPITNDAGLTQISPSTTNPALTKGRDATLLRPSHPGANTYFRVCTTDDRQGAADAAFARKFGYKKAFIVDDDETYGKGLADVFEGDFARGGGTVVGHEHLTKAQIDIEQVLAKIGSAHPDMVFYGGTTVTGGGVLRRKMADSGLQNVAFFGGDGISDDTFLSTAGGMANGTYYTVAAPETSRLTSAARFVAEYRTRWASDVGPYSANAFAATSIEIAAIEKAIKAERGKMPTRAEVLENVAATRNFPTPIGSVGFDANGDITAGVLSLYKIENGKAKFVDQVFERQSAFSQRCREFLERLLSLQRPRTVSLRG
jgi:branched-chain amino acid transport system substrate-binding protein